MAKTDAADDLGFEHIAQVDDGVANHARPDRLKVEGAELVPFGQDDENIGAVGSLVGAIAPCDARKQRFSLASALRVARSYGCAALLQHWHDHQAWRIPHIVGVGLERHAKDRNGLATNRAARRRFDPHSHRKFALVIDALDLLDDRHRRPRFARRTDERRNVFRKA